MVEYTRACLEGLGILPGDTVLLHSDALIVAQFPGFGNENGINAFIDTVEDYLGENGTLILPTFTYSFTRKQVFDVANTPSSVGMITEIFRQRQGVVRSLDAIFSVAASGRNKMLYGQCDVFECFGRESVFGRLHQESGWIVGMGCSVNRITFTHYVEKSVGVDYRYGKIFRGQRVLPGCGQHSCEVSYYVRDLSRKSDIELSRLKTTMIAENTFKQAPLGRVMTWAVKSTDFFNTAESLLKEKNNSLIEEGQL